MPKEENSLASLQFSVRQRMLKIQCPELLAETAQERYDPRKAVELLALKSGYLASQWNVENDPALQVLEDAIVFALVATSPKPEKTAEKVTVAKLDYGTAVRFLKLKSPSGEWSSSDTAAELAMMSDWSGEKIKALTSLPLPGIETEFPPVDAASAQLLAKEGNLAAFAAATELYRDPSRENILKAERLRQGILKERSGQKKSPGTQVSPELYIAFWRSRLFSALLSL